MLGPGWRTTGSWFGGRPFGDDHRSFILAWPVVSIVWAIVGYSIAFDVGKPFAGGLERFLRDVDSLTSGYARPFRTTFMVYRCMFAIIISPDLRRRER